MNFFWELFYQMAVKSSGQHYVTCSFIIPCLKSLQVAMVICLDSEESDFKKQIASALKQSVNFYIEQLCFFKDSFQFDNFKNLKKKKLQTQQKMLKSV